MLTHVLSQLTNEVYDAPTIDDFGINGGLVKSNGEVCPYTLFLGIFVTLLPKVIPMILSQLVADADLRAKYSDENYEEEVEDLFRAKFSHNLKMFEQIITQWQQNNLNLADYGFDFLPVPLARMEVFTGKPTSFQNNLLKGIQFLEYRVEKSKDNDDRITKIANGTWMVAQTVYNTILNWMRPSRHPESHHDYNDIE
jgi:hypothetical protein